MADLRDTGLKVAKYRCFGDIPAGFDQILPFNIIIGRNNTGKSALLDVLAYVVTRKRNEVFNFDWKAAKIVLSGTVGAADTDRVSGRWPPNTLGRRISWSLQVGKQDLEFIDQTDLPEDLTGLWQAVANARPNPFEGQRFKRLAADRDIKPETAGMPNIQESENGDGATRTIHHFRTNATRDSAIVETTILNDLNTIFGPDATFTRIDTREDGATWEVYLDEANKGRIPLSRSGSSLKTILLVLTYLHLIPRIESAAVTNYLYAFEELENNLHPALQRRLLHFLRAFAEEHGCCFFLTTHSPVEIDYFARDPNAQVIHVTHDGTNATTRAVSGYLHGRGILDDLDIRASDLLQSNGIIWVEGPSDRIYLNRWIDLWTNGEFREGAHYQILQYGGALLAHLDAEPPDTDTPSIHILTVNRNAAVLMDSDQRDTTTPLRPTATRIISELARNNGLSWVTSGRTIENYLHPVLLRDTLATVPGQYEDIINLITAQNPTAQNHLPADKVKLARMMTARLTREHLAILDLEARIAELCDRIARWNQLA